MADDTTGFRFLVEQIQLRDKPAVAPREAERGRSNERTARSGKPRGGAGELQDPTRRAGQREPSFLSRRWL